MDNNLQDKLNKSYNSDNIIEKKKKKDNNKKIILAAFGLLILLLLIFFVIKSRKDTGQTTSNNEAVQNVSKGKDNLNKQVRIQDIDNKKDKDKFVLKDEDGRPQLLNENFENNFKENLSPKQLKKVNTPDEYKLVDKEITKARNNFYDEQVNLSTQMKNYAMSKEDGYTSNKKQKYNGELLNDKYVPQTSEDLTSFLSHEIEKRLNPSYSGFSNDEVGLITSLVIEESPYLGPDVPEKVYIPLYEVRIVYSLYKNGLYERDKSTYFSFIIDQEGDIQWIEY